MRLASVLALMVVMVIASVARGEELDVNDDGSAAINLMRTRLGELYSGQVGADGKWTMRAIESLEKRIEQPSEDRMSSSRWAKSRGWRAVFHLNDALALAQCYKSPLSKWFGDTEIKDRIFKALTSALEEAEPGNIDGDDWFVWLITIGQTMSPTLIMMDGELPEELRQRAVKVLREQVGEPMLTGANGIYEARNNLYLGLIDRDVKRIKLGLDFLLPNLVAVGDSGIMEDYSFQFHGSLVYTAGYGTEVVKSAGEMIYLLDGTQWEVPEVNTRIFVNMLLEHARWTVVGQEFDLLVKGRGVLSSFNNDALIEGMLLMGQVYPERSEQLLQAAGQMLDGRKAGLGLRISPLADEAERLDVKPLTGFRYYYTSDYGVFRRPKFFVGVRMHSQRTMDYEGNWGQNLSGWNLGSGMTYISRSGHELWSDKPSPISYLDWDRLPGTTTRVGVHPSQSYNFGRNAYSGGAGLEEAGVMGFKYQAVAGDLLARKSYHFFDMGFVAMGSGITGSRQRNESVVTTVAQQVTPAEDSLIQVSGGRKLEKVDSEIALEDVSWVWLDGMGYVFPKSVKLYVKRDRKLTTLWLDHGANPRDESYAYIVLPDVTLQRVKHFVKQSTVRVVEHGGAVHAVEDLVANAVSYVFWQRGKVGPVGVDKPAVVYCRKDERGLAVALQNPLFTSSDVTVSIEHPAEIVALGEGASVARDGDTTAITFATRAGRIYRAGLGGIVPLQVPHEELPLFEEYVVEATHGREATIFDIKLPAVAVREGYRLIINSHKGQRMEELTDADVVGGSQDGQAVKYRWDRSNNERFSYGDYRLRLHTPTYAAQRYFTVPYRGEAIEGRDLRIDLNRPR